MTQKDEKRIFIREVENPCADCENKGCNVCKCGEIWKASIPRDEAVERMAKVLKCKNCGKKLSLKKIEAGNEFCCQKCGAEYREMAKKIKG